MLNDPYRAGEVKGQLLKSLDDELYVSTWMEQNSTILNALIVEKNVMFYLLFFIVIVAALVHPQRANHLRRPEDP